MRRVGERLHWSDESFEHITQPKLVYISHPTEYGTLYTKKELEELKQACEDCGMYLFLDGARMGYGLCAEHTDVTLPVIAQNTDVFYIGGTKVGALFGEAVVFPNQALAEDFRYIIKQKGGMLAKGRFLGIQFLELFRDGLYFEISKHAIEMAMILKHGVQALGIPFFMESDTNQQFLILPEEKIRALREEYSFAYIQPYDENSGVIRFCTSWATKECDVRKLLEDFGEAYGTIAEERKCMMRFVTGGACQGKHAFVSEKFPQEMCITIKEEQILENMSAGIDTILQLQKEIVAAELPERQAIVIMNETGSGITPMELSQRKLRDEIGKDRMRPCGRSRRSLSRDCRNWDSD